MRILDTLAVKFVGDYNNLDTAFSTVEKRGLAFSKTLKAGLLAIGGAAISAGALIRKSAKDYDVQAKAEANLLTALKGREDVQQRLISQAQSLQQATLFGDEETIKAQAFLAQLGLQEDAITKLTPLVQDFAQAQGTSLTDAAKLVAKSVGSSTNALSRYGINIEGAVGSNQRLESAINALDTAFGGQASAAAEADTSFTQLINRVGDLSEDLGNALSPALDGLETGLNDVLDSIGDLTGSKGFEDLSIKSGAALSQIGNYLKLLGQQIKLTFNGLKGEAASLAVFTQTLLDGGGLNTANIAATAVEDTFSAINRSTIAEIRQLQDVIKTGYEDFVRDAKLEAIVRQIEQATTSTEDLGNETERTGDKIKKKTEEDTRALDALISKYRELATVQLSPTPDAPAALSISDGNTLPDGFFDFDTSQSLSNVPEIDAGTLAQKRNNDELERSKKLYAELTAGASAFATSIVSSAEKGKGGIAGFASSVLENSRKIIGAFIREGVIGAASKALSSVPPPFGVILAGVAGAAAQGLFDSLISSIKIPALAEGGIALGPTLALIGERGPEKIVPLTGPNAQGGGGDVNVTGITYGRDWVWQNAHANQLDALIN